jgi:hypothetical protein
MIKVLYVNTILLKSNSIFTIIHILFLCTVVFMLWNRKIIGHKTCLQRLNIFSQTKSFPHALLFTGPKDVGKFRFARHFSRMLNSDHLSTLREIEKNICGDVITIGDLWQLGTLENWDVISKTSNFDQCHRTGKEGEAPRRTDAIGIQDIHHFLKPLSRRTVRSWMVGIIRDAQRLTSEAANALLKILEEPPEHTLFILTASHRKSLPETIISRCHEIYFSLHPQYILEEYLSQTDILQDKKNTLLTLAQGRSEYLFQLLENHDFFEYEMQQFQEISRIFNLSSPLKRMKMVEKLVSPQNLPHLDHFLENTLRFLRGSLIERSQAKVSIGEKEFSYSALASLIQSVSETKQALKKNVNKKLALECFLFSIP